MAHNKMIQEGCPCGIPCKNLLDCKKASLPLKISFEKIGKIKIRLSEASMYQRVVLEKYGYEIDSNDPNYMVLDFEDVMIQRQIFKANPKCPTI